MRAVIIVSLCMVLLLTVSCSKQPNLVPVAGELSVFDMSLDPCKFKFHYYSDSEPVEVQFTNLGGKAYQFDMGDGNTIWLEAGESVDYCYTVKLQEAIVRIPITRLDKGTVQNRLILKIEPYKEGGDTR